MPLTATPSIEELTGQLHAVLDIRELWDVTVRLVHALVDADFVCLCLRPFELLPGTIFRDRHGFRSTEELLRFNQLSILQPYILAHPGMTVVRMRDAISDSDLLQTPFYRECMEPCGYFHVGAMAFWNGRSLEGVICAHRSREAGAFSRAEMQRLEKAQPAFSIALSRVLRIHRQNAVRLSLERFMQRVPLPTALLSWDLDLIYGNRAASEAVHLWTLGRDAARLQKPPPSIRLPGELLDLCRRTRDLWRPVPDNPNPGIGISLSQRHASDPSLQATVSVLQFGAEPQQRPTLLIQWSGVSYPGAESASASAPEAGGSFLEKLIRLSPRERELALMVREGLDTAELAARLGKSPLTVKKQLQSIYRKLEVSGRSRLMAVLR